MHRQTRPSPFVFLPFAFPFDAEEQDMRESASHPLKLDGKQLVVDADFSAIQVVPVEADEAPWVEVFARDPERVPVRIEDDGQRVRVAVGAGFESWGPNQWDHGPTKIVVHVPRRVRARIHTSAGKLSARGLSGEIEIRSDAGTIDVESLRGKITLATSAGKIDGTDVSGTLDVESNAGAVRLEIAHLDKGKHRVRTNIGATRIELARGMPVRIEARTTMGSARVSFPTTRDADAVLEVEADLGAVKVRESSRVWVPPIVAETDGAPVASGPFRTAAESDAKPMSEEELGAVLEKVAKGELTPAAARELLRALGHHG